MTVASAWRSNGAVFVDLMLVLLSVQLFVVLLRILNLHVEKTALIAVLAVIVFGYPIIARHRRIPSFGSWVFGTRVYPYSSIEGYSGKGELVVFVPLKNGEYSRRAVAALGVFSGLIGSAFLLASKVAS